MPPAILKGPHETVSAAATSLILIRIKAPPGRMRLSLPSGHQFALT